MTDIDWRRVRPLLRGMLELPEEEHDAYLARSCGDDESLAATLRRLYAEDQADASFVDGPFGARPGRDGRELDSPGEGDHVPGYEIVRRIGRGGMGLVYLAKQIEPVRRTVALKVIKLGMDTEEVLERFEIEKQALARLSHPSVAAVFDAGTTQRGQPYFAMEYVLGPTITDHCDEQRASVQERLELFGQVCDGVQHAHQRGVIHRDLKPSNVLVSTAHDAPLVKIIDFGLARMIEPGDDRGTLLTRAGMMVGTPAYMSPEQASSDPATIDTRTDVYSLGVLLYELLTGALPFTEERLRQTPLLEIQRIIREEEPPRPSARLATLDGERPGLSEARGASTSSLLRILRGDLDWVVMRALEKEPDRRYAAVSELAADVRRFLRGEPVLASPPSAIHRLRKYVRRHRLQVAAVAAVGLTLVGATGVSTALFLEARENERLASESADAERRAKEEALAEQQRAEELREEAESQREIALREGERAEQRSRALRSVVESMANDIGRMIATLPGAGEAKVALTRLAVPHLEELARQYPDDLGLLRGLAMTYIRLGGTLGSPFHANLGETGLARDVLTKGRALSTAILERTPGDPDAVYLVRLACITLGDVLRVSGDLEGARDCLEQALSVDAGDLTGEASVKDRIGLGDLRMRLAEIAYGEGRLDEAEEHCVVAIADMEDVILENPGFLLAYPMLGSFLRIRSRVAAAQGRRDDFLVYGEAGITVALDLLDRAPRHRQGLGLMANFHADLAADAHLHGEYDAAAELWVETCARLEELVSIDPADSRALLEWSDALRSQGNTFVALGDEEAAHRSLELAVARGRQLYERDRANRPAATNLASGLADLAASRRRAGDLDGSSELLDEAEQVAPPGPTGAGPAAGLLTSFRLESERARLATARALSSGPSDAGQVELLEGAHLRWRTALSTLAALRASSLPPPLYENAAERAEEEARRCEELLADPARRER